MVKMGKTLKKTRVTRQRAYVGNACLRGIKCPVGNRRSTFELENEEEDDAGSMNGGETNRRGDLHGLVGVGNPPDPRRHARCRSDSAERPPFVAKVVGGGRHGPYRSVLPSYRLGSRRAAPLIGSG